MVNTQGLHAVQLHAKHNQQSITPLSLWLVVLLSLGHVVALHWRQVVSRCVQNVGPIKYTMDGYHVNYNVKQDIFDLLIPR